MVPQLLTNHHMLNCFGPSQVLGNLHFSSVSGHHQLIKVMVPHLRQLVLNYHELEGLWAKFSVITIFDLFRI